MISQFPLRNIQGSNLPVENQWAFFGVPNYGRSVLNFVSLPVSTVAAMLSFLAYNIVFLDELNEETKKQFSNLTDALVNPRSVMSVKHRNSTQLTWIYLLVQYLQHSSKKSHLRYRCSACHQSSVLRYQILLWLGLFVAPIFSQISLHIFQGERKTDVYCNASTAETLV